MLVVLLCYVYVYHCDVRVLLFPFVELPFLSQWQFGHKSFELDLCIVDFLHLFLFDGVVLGFLKLIKGNGSVDEFLLDESGVDVDEFRFFYILKDSCFLSHFLGGSFEMGKGHYLSLTNFFEIFEGYLFFVRTQHCDHFLHFIHCVVFLYVV